MYPDRSPLGLAPKKVERGADTQTQTGTVAPVKTGLGHQLLLRRADTEENKAGGVIGHELCRLGDGLGLVAHPHRRFVPAHIAQSVTGFHRFDDIGIPANHRHGLMRIDMMVEQFRREVGTGRDMDGLAGNLAEQFEHAAVTHRQPGLGVEARQDRVAFKTDEMVDIGRNNKGKPGTGRTFGNPAHSGVEADLVECRIEEPDMTRAAATVAIRVKIQHIGHAARPISRQKRVFAAIRCKPCADFFRRHASKPAPGGIYSTQGRISEVRSCWSNR